MGVVRTRSELKVYIVRLSLKTIKSKTKKKIPKSYRTAPLQFGAMLRILV